MTIFDHISIGVADPARSRIFYDEVLMPLGLQLLVEKEGAFGYGREEPDFWFSTPLDDLHPAIAGNGTHIAFVAPSREAVHAFHAAALKMGGTDDGPPGPRPPYGPDYYGAFVRDPDGHKIEAVWRDRHCEKRNDEAIQ